MVREKPPAYQWYVTDARADRVFQRMTWAQRGMYRDMLDEQWDNEGAGLPDCPRACAELLGGTEDEWIEAWPILRRKFVDRRSVGRNGASNVHENDAHDPARCVINLKLERQRRELAKLRKVREDAGRKGGYGKSLNRKDLSASKAIANASKAVAEPSSSSSSPTPSSSPSSSPSPKVLAALDETDGRNGQIVFRSKRFVVFRWLYEDLAKMLGPHLEGFALDEWFYELARRADEQGLVVPQRDSGKWLHAQTLAEAQRRGLPIAAAPSASSKTAGNMASLAAFVARGGAK